VNGFFLYCNSFKRLVACDLVEDNIMGWGSAGTPPWQDDKAIDQERHVRKDSEKDAVIKDLQKENERLRKRIEELERQLQELKK
jgi:hypothetical protein